LQQPGSQGFQLKPIGVDFNQTGIDQDDFYLHLEKKEIDSRRIDIRPSEEQEAVDRETSVRRADGKQEQGDDEHVIMIEIEFRLQQKSVSDEEQGKETGATEEEADRGRYAGNEKDIGKVDRQLGSFLNPVKELIPERKRKHALARIEETLPLVQRLNGNQKSHANPHDGQRRGIDRSEQITPGNEPAEAIIESPASSRAIGIHPDCRGPAIWNKTFRICGHGWSLFL
jgi:hypothetical protein